MRKLFRRKVFLKGFALRPILVVKLSVKAFRLRNLPSRVKRMKLSLQLLSKGKSLSLLWTTALRLPSKA